MKILTIDLDIIMKPSIDFYNNLVPRNSWEELLKNPHMQLLRADMDIFSTITIWLQQQFKIKKADQFHFIKSHDDLNKILGQEKNCDLINIDHHHDLGYSNRNIDVLNCGNWVKKLIENKQLNSYTWINNSNSKIYENIQEINDYIRYKVEDVETPYLFKSLTDIDKIVICLSPEWVPPYYQSLYWLWMKLYESHYREYVDII